MNAIYEIDEVETVENWHNVYDAIYEMDGEEKNFH